ncbi:HD domain-containing phosphohydrolase [Myxococcota bacterium]
MNATGKIFLLDRLLADGIVSVEQRERVLALAESMQQPVSEALLDARVLDEPELLKYQANLYRTRFVSTEKLAKADIDLTVLELLPRKIAEHHLVFPVLFDPELQVLSIVTPEPDNADALKEVQLASGAREVRAFVGRPRAVRAAINRSYGGDIHAFANLDQHAHEQFAGMLNVFERTLVTEKSVAAAVASDECHRERVLAPAELERSGTATPGAAGRGILDAGYSETVKVLVTLLENTRSDLRGHSTHVARFVGRTAQRIGLSDVQCSLLKIAAYLHDLGKMGTYHLTALNVAQYEGHATTAKKTYRAPMRLLENVDLPKEVTHTVEQMYERFDGTGFPGNLAAKEISLGARLLAIADTYADLTQNPRNPCRQVLRPVQACDVLIQHRNTVFDPNLVDLFRNTVTGDDVKARLLADRYRVLIVDPDAEESTVLELRLLEHGFEVARAYTSDRALRLLDKGDVQLVVSELDLGPGDGLWLLSEARRRPWGSALPWVFVTSRAGRAEAQRAFELGAADYMTKPISAELLVAKLRQLLAREAAATGKRGIAGSLREMGLPDMVQVLWHGRKTGLLKIRAGGENGEIHFVNGAVFNALWGNLRGEEAFYAMLRFNDGEFLLDPSVKVSQRIIEESPEALLLEGLRRLDEASVGG